MKHLFLILVLLNLSSYSQIKNDNSMYVDKIESSLQYRSQSKVNTEIDAPSTYTNIKCKIVSITKDTIRYFDAVDLKKTLHSIDKIFVNSFEWNSIKFKPSLYQADLYLKQSANLNIASLLIMGLGAGLSFVVPPSGQLPVIASIGLGASITSIISIIKKKKAGKELMLVNMK